jgi:23S rRNA (cytidine1920-2'-O)/16S rRNA (cytidine1409-2'-O)-methyltransferase
MSKERLDAVVQRRLDVSRSKAQGLIQTGQVYDEDGNKLEKPGQRIDPEMPLDIREQPKYVSRGGEKLAAALDEFDLDVTGVTALDVGASTGGFTDCLLQHGASKVYALDVGYGQLAWSLREDPRVVVMERTNVRNLTPDMLDGQPNFFTADCSFISLRLVLPPVTAVLTEDATGVVLIKPQFEAGREDVGKGGVVRDPEVHERVVREVLEVAEENGFCKASVIESPLRGPAGNIEFLAYLQRCNVE